MTRTHVIGRRALAAVVTATLSVTAVQAVAPTIVVAQDAHPSTEGEENVVTASGHSAWNDDTGEGTVTVTKKTVAAGGVLEIKGTGFKPRGKDGWIALKIENGAYKAPKAGKDLTNLDYDQWNGYTLKGDQVSEDGSFTAKLPIPKTMPGGWSFVNVRAGRDTKGLVSKVAWFKVTPGPDSLDPAKAPKEGLKYFVSASGNHPRGPEMGKGIAVPYDDEPVEVEKPIQIDGEEMTPRGKDGQLVYKIEDGAYAFTRPGKDEQDEPLSVKNGALVVTGYGLPSTGGGGYLNTLYLPKEVPNGWTYITVLGGKDGKEKVYKTVWVKVTGSSATPKPPEPTTPPTSETPTPPTTTTPDNSETPTPPTTSEPPTPPTTSEPPSTTNSPEVPDTSENPEPSDNPRPIGSSLGGGAQKGSSQGAMPILAIGGALAALSGIVWFAITHGMIPASMLPPQLKAMLHL